MSEKGVGACAYKLCAAGTCVDKWGLTWTSSKQLGLARTSQANNKEQRPVCISSKQQGLVRTSGM